MKAIMKIATTACLGLHGARAAQVNVDEVMELTDAQLEGIMGSEEQQVEAMQLQELQDKLAGAGMQMQLTEAKLHEYLVNSEYDVDTAVVLCLSEVADMPVVQASTSAAPADASVVATDGLPVVQAEAPIENQEMVGETSPTGMSEDERATLEAIFAEDPEKAVAMADFLDQNPTVPFEYALEVLTAENGLTGLEDDVDVMSAEGTTTPPLQQQAAAADIDPEHAPRQAVAAVMGAAEQQEPRRASLASLTSMLPGGKKKDVAAERRSGTGFGSMLRGGMGGRKTSGGRGNGSGGRSWMGAGLFGGRGAGSARYGALEQGLLAGGDEPALPEVAFPAPHVSGIGASINGDDNEGSPTTAMYRAI